jgi:hypothetical protein
VQVLHSCWLLRQLPPVPQQAGHSGGGTQAPPPLQSVRQEQESTQSMPPVQVPVSVHSTAPHSDET